MRDRSELKGGRIVDRIFHARHFDALPSEYTCVFEINKVSFQSNNMNYRQFLFFLLVFLTPLHKLRAQQSINSGGGDLDESAGSQSFSIGEVFYETVLSNGSFAYGIQQAYPDSAANGLINQTHDFSISVFPNPHSDALVLQCQEIPSGQLSYQLTDASGRIVLSSAISGLRTTIDTSALPEASYFIQVIPEHASTPGCLFKIIKTKR